MNFQVYKCIQHIRYSFKSIKANRMWEISILARCSQWLRVLDFFQNKNIGISQNAGFRGFSYGFVVVQVVFTFFDRTTSLGFGRI